MNFLKKMLSKKIAEKIVNDLTYETRVVKNVEYVDERPEFLKNLQNQHEKAEQNNCPKYVLRLLTISNTAFYGGDFWGMHLFDSTADEDVFKENLNKIMPFLEKIKKFQIEKDDYFHEYYLEKDDLLPFKNFDDYISYGFENNNSIKDDVEFIMNYREQISNLHT